MEHEVFVPVATETLRQLLRDPARVARCVPGLQQDADASAGPLSGRLKVRVGGHTITYRGALHITERAEAFAVEGEGAEVRGTGSVKVTLMIRPEPAEGGTTLSFTGSSHAEGRLAELAPDAAASAARRLLDRLVAEAAALVTEPTGSDRSVDGDDVAADGSADVPDAASGPGSAGRTVRSNGSAPGPSGPDDAAAGADADTTASAPESGEAAAADRAADTPSDPGAAGSAGDDSTDPTSSVFETPVPLPSLGPDADEQFDDIDRLDGTDELADDEPEDEPPAEAAHARRTMIGRSAEEVDHAPPRGRYAPTPAPDATSAGATLRWIAPAAALALASAVVVGRVLRRRK
ncbi:SRPBCC domain-containing protein [Streptomyces sp. NPDC002889]|uniref:SRPBCC domain-containing protein n=1 Tax=Streptomyces sp. NPDC002889 TaxID=3364669 RepID=UPI003687B27F